MKKYEWLLFDNDNTLMNFHSASTSAFHGSMRELGLNEDKIDYREYNTHNHIVWSEFENGFIDALTLRSKRFKLYFEAVGHEHSDPTIANAIYLNHLILHPHMMDHAYDLLDHVKSSYKLGLITNGLKEVQRPRLKAAKIYDYFDTIVVSDEIGYAKPQQGYFDHVFSQMGPTELKKTIVIGDSLNSDIKGALDYGLDCVWLNPERKSHGGLKPTYEVRSVKEIIELFSM